MDKSEDYLDMKAKIYDDKKHFMLYKTAMVIIPSLLATVLVGHWTDTYIKAKKWLLITGALAIVAECVILILNDYYFDLDKSYVLLAYVPGILSGGLFAVLTAIWPYIAMTTPMHMITKRITIAETINLLAQALGTYGAYHMLIAQPMFNQGQLHNYSGVFTISGAVIVLAMLWAVFMVDKERDIRRWEYRFGCVPNREVTGVEHTVTAKIRHFMDHEFIHPLKLLFNIKNGHKMLLSLFRRRDNFMRLQILTLFISVITYVSSNLGPIVFGYQFAKRVYGWDSNTYINAQTFGCLGIAAGTLVAAPILLGFKLKDTSLSLIGLASLFTLHLIRGVVTRPSYFYYSIIPGCLTAFTIIGIRSHLSKLIKGHEMGKVLSLFAATEATTPLIATEIINIIFTATIDELDGLPFIIVACILVVPFVVIVWIHNFTILPEHNHGGHSDTVNVGNNFALKTRNTNQDSHDNHIYPRL